MIILLLVIFLQVLDSNLESSTRITLVIRRSPTYKEGNLSITLFSIQQPFNYTFLLLSYNCSLLVISKASINDSVYAAAL